MAKASDTSITTTAALKHLKEAKVKANLPCKKITGFYLHKTSTGGSWRYRYQDNDGKVRNATIGRYSELKPQEAAEKALEWRNNQVDVFREKQTTQQQRKEADRQAQARTLGQYLTGIYTQYQKRKKSGESTLSMIAGKYADWLDRDMATLSRADVRAWQAEQEQLGLAHATIKRAYGALKTLLNHAVTEGMLEANPLASVKLQEESDTEKQARLKGKRTSSRRMLTDDEMSRLQYGLDAFSEEIRSKRRNSRAHGKPHLPDLDDVVFTHWFHPFTIIALYTGLRTGDIYSLEWTEINLTFKRLRKMPEKTRHHPDPAEILMDLPEALVKQMDIWWQQLGKPEAGLVFPSPKSGKRMDKNAHDRHWKKLLELSRLPDDLTFYSLRHNFISTLVANGVPMLTVARLAGHKGTAMIEQHYGHLCPESAATALQAIGSRVEKSAQHDRDQNEKTDDKKVTASATLS